MFKNKMLRSNSTIFVYDQNDKFKTEFGIYLILPKKNIPRDTIKSRIEH